MPPEKPLEPVDGREVPEFDALLLYLYLSGGYKYKAIRGIVGDIVDFEVKRLDRGGRMVDPLTARHLTFQPA